MKENIIIFYIISLLIFSNQQCDSISTKIRNECFTVSSPEAYCCHDAENSRCILVKKNELLSHSNYDCGISGDNFGKYEFGEYHPEQKFNIGFQSCGKSNPKKMTDCTEYSEITNSCCLFKKEDMKACFSIGKRYIGKSKYIDYSDNKEVSYECKSRNLIINIYYYLMIVFIFI